MIDVILLGVAGRMGQALCQRIAPRSDCRVVGGVDICAADMPFPVAASLPKLGVRADVVIDFSNPKATKAAVAWCLQNKLPYVVCTTGLDEQTQASIAQAATEIPVFQSANMSIGINLMAQLAQKAAALLGQDFDIEIIEKHHRNKLDAPSGTALLLADEINAALPQPYHYMYNRHPLRQKRSQNEIGIHAVRGGSIVGEHEILFCGADEVITLSHSASSRSVFANGAINAALYLCHKQAGLYTMQQLVQEMAQ